MIKIIKIFFQLVFLTAVVFLTIEYSRPISLLFNDVVITFSSSIVIFAIVLIIIIALFFQRIIFFLKTSTLKFQQNRELSFHKKGYDSFVKGMVAIANKDFKTAIKESTSVNKFLREEPLSYLLRSEALKIEKKYTELTSVYEKMISNKKTNLLGLRGLMEQNLRNQDYHHAFIYGEKLFNINPRLEKLYETLINIISKTKNWNKLIQLSNDSYKHRLIDRKHKDLNISISYFEIAKIKYQSDNDEAAELMEKAIKLRGFFSPYICFYLDILIKQSRLEKAKKILKKAWTNNPHPDLKGYIEVLSKVLGISAIQLSKFVTSGNLNNYYSTILLTESQIKDEKWKEAKEYLKPLINQRPFKEVCLLMAKIEEGETGDIQKINSWINRGNVGKLSKIWICKVTGLTQQHWSSTSEGGFFNSLNWDYPKNQFQFNSSDIEKSSIEYINN